MCLAVFGCQDLSLCPKRVIIRIVRTTAFMMEGRMEPNLQQTKTQAVSIDSDYVVSDVVGFRFFRCSVA